ncbi:MAG: DUF5320 domain-containing protein [Candidatus Cloacimonadales bacterium]
MPKRDGTGPDGKGPQTGRGTGNCSDKPSDKKPLLKFKARDVEMGQEEDKEEVN